MRNTPLRCAVGAVVNEEACFIGGAVDAVRARSKAFVVLVPGDLGKDLLKTVLKTLTLSFLKRTGKNWVKPRLSRFASLFLTLKEQ